MKQKCSFILKASTALLLAFLMLFGTVATSLAAVVDDAEVGAQAEDIADTGAEADVADEGAEVDVAETGGTNWNANIFFRVPDGWNLSTYPNVQAWAVQSSSASSGTKYAFLLGNMSVAGTTSNSRLYHAWVSANHSPWGTEYIAFTANTSNWGTGDFYISTCGQYTAPLSYGATNSTGSYLFTPSNASNNTASNNNTISGSYNGTNRDVLKKNQDFYVYTGGSSGAAGGSVKVDAYYVNGSSFNGSGAIATSSITVNSSDSGAHEQYGGAVEGTKVSMTATPNTGYKFDGYYDAATGGNLISSSASYNYYVFGAKSVYARFSLKTYTITYNKGANGTGTVASTTKTHGTNATLSSSTFTRTGYTQDGWSTTDGGAKAYNLGGSYTTDADVTLYPHWLANTTPSIDTFTIGGASSKTLNIGETATLASTASNAGGNSVTYSTTSDAISISGTTVTALKPVTNATITASLTGATSKTVQITVSSPTVSLTTTTAQSLNVNGTHTNTATGSTIGSAATGSISYSVGSSTYISVSDAGVVTGLKPTSTAQTMTATYTVTCGGQTTTATKTCNYTVKTPVLTNSASTSMNVDATQTLSASVTNTTGTPSYTWTVTNGTGTASLSNGTTLKALTPGKVTAKVRATFNSSYYLEKDATITIATPSITQGTVTIAKGDSKTLSTATTSPTGLAVTFALSGSPNGVTCTSAGVVTVAQNSSASTATVVATAKNSAGTQVATKNITVTIASPSLDIKVNNASVADTTQYFTKNTNRTFTVDSNFSDALTAKSSNNSIATVSLSGTTLTITPKAKGTCKISVSSDSGFAPTGAAAVFSQAAADEPSGALKDAFDLAATAAVDAQTVQFTANVAEADTYKYLYFTDGVGWSGVKAYLYGDGNNASFPGEAMVKIGKNEENKDVYAIRYPATKNYTNVIISKDGEQGTRVKYNNTNDLPMPSNGNNAYWANDTAGDAGQWNCTIVKPQITANDVTIDMGGTGTMTATVLTSGTPSTFNWSSGTTSVATTADTHTASNVITGVAPGTSTITIKAYAEKPSNFNSIVTDGTADNYVAGIATATATVVAENKTVTFGEKKTDNGSTFTDGSGHITAKYYDEDTSSGSGSSGSTPEPEEEPAGGPYYLHIGKQNAFITNTAIQFTWNGSYYYAQYTVDTANADYPFVINTKNTALGDSDKSSSNQAITALASSCNPDNISMWYTPVYNSNAYSGYAAFKFGVNSGSTGTIYITFTPSGGVVFRTSISSGSGSGSGGSGSGEGGSGTGYTGEGTTMTSPHSVPYGKVAVFTAQATYTSGTDTYAFAEWVDGSNNTLSKDLEYVVKITEAKNVYARYYKVFKLSAFDSYEKVGSSVNFVTAPPKTITIKHGDDTYTYSFDGKAPGGHPGTPDDPQATYPDPLPVNSGGTYGQGNYIQYLAGDEITLIYSAMASSETFKGVFYNNSVEYYLAKPTAQGYISHTYAADKTLYMNSAYYESSQVPSGLPTTTVDHDAHSIKFTGTQDYKNIDIEVGTKRKVYFSDYTNAIIGSKNVDDYYYDGEALSATGDQLTVKAAGSATQTNVIDRTKVKFYAADANGQKTGGELTGFTVSYSDGSEVVTNNGATASTRYIIINGDMPHHDLYIDLGMTNSYTIKLGSKVMSDSFASKTRLAEVATVTIKEGSTTKLTAPNNADVTSTSYSAPTATALTLTTAYTGSWDDYYTFVGWYWGDDTAPDYAKGFISDKLTLNYTPKKGGTIWAVGTRSLYINGSKYITGKDTDWYGENNVQKNLEMSFDAESGRYYWEITDTMFASAGSNFKTWKEENSSATTEYGRYHTGDDQNLYWYNTDDKYHGKGFFQLFDQESGNANKTIWDQITYFAVDESANGPTYGKVYPPEGTYEDKQHNGQGFINFNETNYAGQSSPLRIYFNPSATGNARLTVESTKIYSNLYVSNGFTVGSTLRTSNVTVEPVVDGVVKTEGQTGYFSVGKQGTGWDPDMEGHVNHYKPQKKGATVRITKTAGGSDKIVAFFIYDITNKTVRAERDVKKTASGNNYYIDLTLANEEQNLYIVPIVEEAGANVTISFDATQLNRAQWGDIVTAYAWYSGSGGDALGAYPGQPMIPSDDMTTWTTTFKGTNSNNDELQGITFSNYVDGAHSWLGCSGVMGTVSDHTTGTASGGIVNVYNHVYSGTNGEYARTNFKAQTYDYREPIALYDRFKDVAGEGGQVSISFSMKDGNSSLLSWHHSELLANNILNLPDGWSPLRWEYLTNAKGDKYIDMNGNTMKTKPTASFYVAAKGQVMYGSSNMNYVFYGGKGYDAVSGVTYGAASGVGMNYAVEWYVYDASGKYITNVLTAGIADLASNNVDSYIGKRLEDMGYAVDGKSVAICYDKPRYMYGDADSGSGAVGYNNKRINVGNDFDAYRFTGQWNAVASSDLVKVNVGVGMMTDSGEVLANSNTAAYGNAKAYYDDSKGNNTPVTNEDGDNAPFTANDNSFVRTAVRDAKNSPVKLNASAQNFIGWYYYDANTGDFVKANYAGNENFYPNYSNKDVTFYAMYRASAVYQYKYTGREGDRIYSASGEDLTAAEMGNGNKINAASHETDIKKKVPVGIGIFKKNIDFSSSNYGSWTKTADDNGYILNITGFTTSVPEYTLTAHYKDASGADCTMTKKAVYNGSAVNLTALNGGTPVTSIYGKTFLGWYAYDNNTVGDLLSTQANYGMRLTRDQAIIAVYDEDGATTRPEDSEVNWSVHIDENVVNKELTTSTTGVYYNDTIIRVRKGSDVTATFDSGTVIGVLIVNDNKDSTLDTRSFNGNNSQLTTIANAVASGKSAKLKNGMVVTNMQTANHTGFNRTDIAIRADYAKYLGARYTAYAYIKVGSTYYFSDASAVKTYE